MARYPLRLLGALALASATLASCGGSNSNSGPGTAAGGSRNGFLVVVAENFWGSIAGQLGGSKVDVRSLIVNPGTDPHSYVPTAGDSRLLAQSRMAIVNGIGYDRWAAQALAANPEKNRLVLDNGKALGLEGGANPHQWYSPGSVLRVVDAIVADYVKLDPTDAAYFDQQRTAFLTSGLARYNHLRAEIRRRFSGVPVGYSESVFEPLGQDLGLTLKTPAGFAKAIAEGADVAGQDKLALERQAQTRQFKVWVYNSQNVTPDVRRANAIVAAAGIPIVTVTETLAPAGVSFERWQGGQLAALLAALHRATGR